MRGRKGQAAYGGCDAQLVLAGHNPKDERAEPEVGIPPWKTVTKNGKDFRDNFPHMLWKDDWKRAILPIDDPASVAFLFAL